MFRQLRRKFIGLSMLSVLIVLTLIMGAVNLINYRSMTKSADQKLVLLAGQGGRFGSKPPEDKPPGDFDAETPFSSRYFSVNLSANNQVTASDTDHIAAINAEQAASYAQKLASGGLPRQGYLGRYRYLLQEKSADQGKSKSDSQSQDKKTDSSDTTARTYYFLDTQPQMQSFYSFLYGSLAAGAGGLLFVFLLLLPASRRAVGPIVESYSKQRQFITDASHELKTPLAVLAANNEVIEMDYGTSEWTVSNHRQIDRLNALVEKLVFLSRMEEEGPRLTIEKVDFSQMVLEAAESFDAPARASGRSLTISVAPSISLECDPASMQQLLNLLLDNALKYSDQGGSIEVTLASTAKGKLLTIRNTVDSIPQGDLSRLFERFYRLDSSRNSKTGGYGIGLAVAKAIVKTHKGKITATSPDGKSVIFTVILP